MIYYYYGSWLILGFIGLLINFIAPQELQATSVFDASRRAHQSLVVNWTEVRPLMWSCNELGVYTHGGRKGTNNIHSTHISILFDGCYVASIRASKNPFVARCIYPWELWLLWHNQIQSVPGGQHWNGGGGENSRLWKLWKQQLLNHF